MWKTRVFFPNYKKYIFLFAFSHNIFFQMHDFKLNARKQISCTSPSNLLILFSFILVPKSQSLFFNQKTTKSNDKSSLEIYCNRYIAAFVYPRILLLHIGRALLEIIRLTQRNKFLCVCRKFLRSRVSIFSVAINLITRSVLLNFHQRTERKKKKTNNNNSKRYTHSLTYAHTHTLIRNISNEMVEEKQIQPIWSIFM